VIHQLHGCDSKWIETVPVHETFRGKTVWKGFVEVFELRGHPKAKRAYGWSHAEGDDDQGERFVTVLGLPPVDSPLGAVKAAAAQEIRQQRSNIG
jgi:hypothetical protein